ncbi:Ubiquitin carboxyl-terminal hydrolase 8 [Nymphon striatum]|nr:Ubiquitin carboxyl-terminal hydrolase 8 [Nymphon striatum]
MSSQKRKVPENGDVSRKTARCSAQQVAAILESDDEETLGFDEDYPSDELKTDSDDNVENDNDSESDSDNENPVDRLPVRPFIGHNLDSGWNKKLISAASTLYDAADESHKNGDEERSYILFMRFYNVIDLLKQTPEYKKDKIYYNSIISKIKMITAIECAEKLLENLRKRYDLKSEEAEVAKALKEKDEKEKKTFNEEEKDGPVVIYKDLIDCRSLYGLISKKKSLIIMDVRSADDYETSHIKHSSCINVPNSILRPGITAEKVQSNLPVEAIPQWNERKDVDYVIFLDQSSKIIDSDNALHHLKEAICKWDRVNKLKNSPLLLKGGFQDWILYYPTVTTNPQSNNITVHIESGPDITGLEYPDLENFDKPILPKKSEPENQFKNIVPHISSPQINGDISDQVKTNAVPIFNRSLKPKQVQNEDESPTFEPKPEYSETIDFQEGKKEEGLDEALQEKIKDLGDDFKRADEERLMLLKENDRIKSEMENLSKETEKLKIREELRKKSKYNENRRLELEAEKMSEQRRKNILEKKKEEVTFNDSEKKDIIEFDTKKKNEKEQIGKEEVEQKTANEQKLLLSKKFLQKNDIPTVMRDKKPKVETNPADKSTVFIDKDVTTTKLKYETDSPPRKLGLSRSHSSPNIAKLVDEEDMKKPLPIVNRTAKPKVKPEMFSPEMNRQFKPQAVDINAARQRNLMPIYGNQGSGLTGLKNLGNTCFMNSIIQCLANTIHLCLYFVSGTFRHHINKQNKRGTRGDLAEEFSVIIRSLWCNQYRSITPKDFKSKAGKYIDICSGYDQQDSHEFLTVVMEKLHQDVNTATIVGNLKPPDLDDMLQSEAIIAFWKYHKLLNQSVITELFEGLMCSTLQCLHCSKKSYSFEEFMCLSLPVPSSASCSLKDCLSTFLKVEKMTGEAKWRCPSCKVPRDAQKKIDICKLPKILVIHLKRFSYEGMWRRKLQTHVDFPFSNFNIVTSSPDPDGHHLFDLYGVSNHYGTLEGGHYTAFCKNNVKDKWYKYDDHEVGEIAPNIVKFSIEQVAVSLSSLLGLKQPDSPSKVKVIRSRTL